MGLPVSRLILRILREDGRERSENVMQSVVIGADPAKCSLVLDSPYVSSVHARIDGKSDGYYCVDAGGKNGTLVNRTPATRPIRLHDGDVIEIADFRLSCQFGTQPYDPRWGLKVLTGEHKVLIGGVELKPPLGPKEFNLLALLWGADGYVVSHEEIGRAVWGEDMYTATNIQRLVADLRARVEPDKRHPQYIINVQRKGYRLEWPRRSHRE